MHSLLNKKILTKNGYYIYDTWTNEILQVDKEIFTLIPDNYPEVEPVSSTVNNDHNVLLEAIKNAKEYGFFSEILPEVSAFEELSLQDVKQLLEKGPQHLVLNITDECNLRCTYCSFSGAYEHHRSHSEGSMSTDVIDAALDFYLNFDCQPKSIGFYGGEPLLQFSLIKYALQAAQQRTSIPIQYRITTNGTLLSQEICEYLIRHDFAVTISLDGPQEVHDRYRVDANGKGSFSRLWRGLETLRRLDTAYFKRKVAFNLVAAHPLKLITIHNFIEKNAELFHGQRISVSTINPYPSELPSHILKETETPDPQSQRDYLFSVFKNQLLQGAYTENLPVNIFATDFLDIHKRSMERMPIVTSPQGQCIPGHAKCFVSTHGILYMCERVGCARPIGTVWEGLDSTAIINFLEDFNQFTSNTCRQCWAMRLCNRCFVHLNYGDGFSAKRFDTFCQSTKRHWHRMLTDYCSIREENFDAFSSLE